MAAPRGTPAVPANLKPVQIKDPVAYTDNTAEGTPFFIAYDSRSLRKESTMIFPNGNFELANWSRRLEVLAAMCIFRDQEYAGAKRRKIDELNAGTKELIVKELSNTQLRQAVSVYTAYYQSTGRAGDGPLAPEYIGWMAINHQSTPAPHELIYLCVSPRFQRRGIGAALIAHYENVVSVQDAAWWPGGDAERKGWARVFNTRGARQLYLRAGWRYPSPQICRIPALDAILADDDPTPLRTTDVRTVIMERRIAAAQIVALPQGE